MLSNCFSIQCIEKPKRHSVWLQSLVSLWRESVIETHEFLSKVDIDTIEPYVWKGLADIECLYVGCEGDQAVAFMGVEDRKIEMLFVRPSHIGQGIGTILMKQAIFECQAYFVDVNVQNPRAEQFYRKFGFYVYNRNENDALGKPFPILQMKLPNCK